MANYQVLFNGEISPHTDEAIARSNMAEALGLSELKVKQLFSGRTVVIRSQLSELDAQAWASRLAELGAICRIRDLSPREEKVDFSVDKYNRDNTDRTLREITAAHVECPRCSHMQLDASSCARCGVDLEVAMRRKHKEDLMIEKKLRELREPKAPKQAGNVQSFPQIHITTEDESRTVEPEKRGLIGWLRR